MTSPRYWGYSGLKRPRSLTSTYRGIAIYVSHHLGLRDAPAEDIFTAGGPPWQSFPFPLANLQVLNVSETAFESLPIRLVALAHFRRVRIRRTALHTTRGLTPITRATLPSPPPRDDSRKGARPLVHLAIEKLLGQPVDDVSAGLRDVPADLRQAVETSYLCEICGRAQVTPPSSAKAGLEETWMAERVELRCTVQSRPKSEIERRRSGLRRPPIDVRVGGRVCRVCLVWLTV